MDVGETWGRRNNSVNTIKWIPCNTISYGPVYGPVYPLYTDPLYTDPMYTDPLYTDPL